MGVFLLLTSFVTTLLVPEEAYRIGGPASGRAVSYLAHNLMGGVFGTIYDFSTIAILWFAGASAMAGLLNLIPRYLPRYGMAPRWVSYRRPLVLVLFIVSIIITVLFKASVEAQAGAYATGVLVLILSAGVAVALALWQESTEKYKRRVVTQGLSLYFWSISIVFLYTLVDNIIERPDGVIIASLFIIIMILISAFSRARRAIELRVSDIDFMNQTSGKLWHSLLNKKVNLVPIRTCTPEFRTRKANELKAQYLINQPLAFIHIHLLDNRSEFMSPLRAQVSQEQGNFIIEIWGAVAIANTIAYVSELIDPVNIFLGLTRENLMTQSLRYLLWGEGEIGLMVYTILIRYWQWTPEEDVRPNIILASE